jgi:hypothetical protein
LNSSLDVSYDMMHRFKFRLAGSKQRHAKWTLRVRIYELCER